MTTINLHQSEKNDPKIISGGRGGLFFTLVIFILTILVLVGMKMAVASVQKQNADLQIKIDGAKKSLTGLDDINQVADMQERLKEIKTNLKIENGKVSRISMPEVLGYIGDSMDSSGVFLASYKYEEGDKISLSINADSFSDAAKQVFNFKKSQHFSNVSLDKIGRGEKYVMLELSMDLVK